MGKCWLFEETDITKVPDRMEWINSLKADGFRPERATGINWKMPILKFTEFSQNPMEPIREVASNIDLENIPVANWKETIAYAGVLARAICESCRRMEGK